MDWVAEAETCEEGGNEANFCGAKVEEPVGNGKGCRFKEVDGGDTNALWGKLNEEESNGECCVGNGITVDCSGALKAKGNESKEVDGGVAHAGIGVDEKVPKEDVPREEAPSAS